MRLIGNMLKYNMINSFDLVFSKKGNLILVYDQDHDKLGVVKLKPLCHVTKAF